MSKQPSGNGWSWEPLEPEFQRQLPILFGDRKPETEDEEARLKKIHFAIVATASLILRAPRFRGVDCDPNVAAQMWFIVIRKAKHRYDRDRPFHKLGYTILSHICCDLGRRGRVRHTAKIPSGTVSSLAQPLELVIRKDQRQHVRRTLRTLKLNGEMSRDQRTAIALKYYRGMSSQEAAERCGVSAAMIDQRTYQSRQLLLKQLCKQRIEAS